MRSEPEVDLGVLPIAGRRFFRRKSSRRILNSERPDGGGSARDNQGSDKLTAILGHSFPRETPKRRDLGYAGRVALENSEIDHSGIVILSINKQFLSGIMQDLSFLNADTIFLHDQNFERAMLGESFRFAQNRN